MIVPLGVIFCHPFDPVEKVFRSLTFYLEIISFDNVVDCLPIRFDTCKVIFQPVVYTCPLSKLFGVFACDFSTPVASRGVGSSPRRQTANSSIVSNEVYRLPLLILKLSKSTRCPPNILTCRKVLLSNEFTCLTEIHRRIST